MDFEAIKKAAQGYQADMTRFLRDMIAIPSESCEEKGVANRIEELNEMHGAYNVEEAKLDHNLHMLGLKTDNLMELTYTDRKRIHNLKYYTWVEQQQMDVEDLNAQWYDTKGTWDAVHAQAKDLDELINEFNEATGLLKAL